MLEQKDREIFQTIYLCDQTVARLKIPGNKVIMRFGSFEQPVTIAQMPYEKIRQEQIPEELRHQIDLPDGIRINLHQKYDQEHNVLEFGPTIGFLNHIWTDNKGRIHIKGSATFASQIVSQADKAAAFICFIDTDQQDSQILSSGRVNVYIPLGNKVFKNATIPIPSMIYDRDIYGKNEPIREKIVKAADFLLLSEKVRQLTKDKLFFSQMLDNNQELSIYSPATVLLNNKSFRLFSEKYQHIVVKPRHGLQSGGIFDIKAENEGWLVRYEKISGSSEDFELHEVYVPDWESLMEIIKEKGDKDEYIVQEYIPYALYHFCDKKGKPRARKVELRTLLSGGNEGKLDINGSIIRLHDPQLIGREFFSDPVLLLPKIFPDKYPDIIKLVEQLSMLIYKNIEDVCDANIACLAVDFAITSEGKPMILEANSKPAAVPLLRKIGNTEAQMQVTQRLLDYANYLFLK